jgi:hypothetical protein
MISGKEAISFTRRSFWKAVSDPNTFWRVSILEKFRWIYPRGYRIILRMYQWTISSEDHLETFNWWVGSFTQVQIHLLCLKLLKPWEKINCHLTCISMLVCEYFVYNLYQSVQVICFSLSCSPCELPGHKEYTLSLSTYRSAWHIQ